MTRPEYWDSLEYKADQEAFDGGQLTPNELWLMALQWGVESKVNIMKTWQPSREVYMKKAVANHRQVWMNQGKFPIPLEIFLYGKVLDLGCGVASFLEELPYVQEVVAVDPCLNDYAERLPQFTILGESGNCRYVNGVIQDVEEEDFDVVYSFNAIDHGIEWEDILANCARVLKLFGSLLLGVHVCERGPRTGHHRRLTHPSHFSSEQLWNELERVGLKVLYHNERTNDNSSWLSYTWARRYQ